MKYSVQHLLLYHQHLHQVTGGCLSKEMLKIPLERLMVRSFFWKFQPKIEDNNFQKFIHSGWLNQVEYYKSIANFFGSRLQPHKFARFWIQMVTDVAVLRPFYGRLVNRTWLWFGHPLNRIFLWNCYLDYFMLPLLPFMISLKVLQAIFLAGKNKTTTTAANFYHDQPTFKFWLMQWCRFMWLSKIP